MKKIVFIICCQFPLIFGVHAQEKDSLVIPDEVMQTFVELYKDTSNVSWEERNDVFVADFLQLGDPFIAEIDKEGNWVSSKETIMRRQVEDDLIDMVEEAYPEHDLSRFFNYKNNNQETFVVFELTQGDSKTFVRQAADGGVVPLD